jgi:hypothetical protein
VGAATTGGVAGTLLSDTVVCNDEPSRAQGKLAARTLAIREAVADLKLGCSVTAQNAQPNPPVRRLVAAAYCGFTDTRKADSKTMSEDKGLRDRVVKEGEEAIGKFAQQLIENPAVSSALSAAFETRERAARAQELAMGALNLPSASDLERLTRRVRSVSQRLEGIEDGLDRLEQRIESLGTSSAIDQRLASIEEKLDALKKAKKAG